MSRTLRSASGGHAPSKPTGAKAGPFCMLHAMAATCFLSKGKRDGCTDTLRPKLWSTALASHCLTVMVERQQESAKVRTAWLLFISAVPATGNAMTDQSLRSKGCWSYKMLLLGDLGSWIRDPIFKIPQDSSWRILNPELKIPKSELKSENQVQVNQA